MRTLIFLSLLVSLATFPLVALAVATGTINGTVVSAEGKPAPSQKVRIKKVFGKAPVGKDSTGAKDGKDGLVVATLSTDKDGKFSQSLEPGEYWAEAGSKSAGYAKERFSVKPGETTEVKLALQKDDVKKD